jgi:branched-subunit amino acid aminotransferase/4-amino-4-deoxychorismate lyase
MAHAFLLGTEGFVSGGAIPITDRGFRYGMSVFETIGIRGGVPLLLDGHLESLDKAAQAPAFPLPNGWREAAAALLSAPPIVEGVGRVYATAGDRDGDTARIAILFEEMPISDRLSSSQAVTVEFVAPTPYGKTGNYWPHFLARPISGDEAILCSPGGLVLCGAMANLFLVQDGALITPERPVRNGVVRQWVFDGFAADQAPIKRDELGLVEDAFLTNSRLGIHRLSSIDGRELPGSSLTEAVWRKYRTEVLRAG